MDTLSIKYRPRSFDDLFGHEVMKKDLKKRAQADKWHKLFLLRGLYGSGKTTTAQIIAMTMQCRNVKDGNPCCECDSCKSIMDETFNRDTVLLDGGQFSGKDSVIEFTREVNVSPLYDRRRVYIIEEADQLSSAALSTLLKITEGPRDKVHFILLSMMSSNTISSAIQSRALSYQFKPLSTAEMMKALKSIMEKEGRWSDPSIPDEFRTEGLATLASCSQGSLRNAIQLLDRSLVGEIFTKQGLLDEFGIIDEVATYAILEGLLQLTKDESIINSLYSADPMELHNYMTAVLADVMMYKHTGYVKDERFLGSTKHMAHSASLELLFNTLTTHPQLTKPYMRKADILSAIAAYYCACDKTPVRSIPTRRIG